MDASALILCEYFQGRDPSLLDNVVTIPGGTFRTQSIRKLEGIHHSVLRNCERREGVLQVDGCGEDSIVDFDEGRVLVPDEILEGGPSRLED